MRELWSQKTSEMVDRSVELDLDEVKLALAKYLNVPDADVDFVFDQENQVFVLELRHKA